MSAITLAEKSCYLLDLTPGTVLTLTTPVRLRDTANILVFNIPALLAGAGVAVTQGAIGKTADPVLPTVQSGPTVGAAAAETPMLVGPAIYSIALREIEWKFLLSPLQLANIFVIVYGGLDQDLAFTASPIPAARRIGGT